MELYTQILDHAGLAVGTILRHIRDKPIEGCLFHCTGTSPGRVSTLYSYDSTAGKDRTGVITAILLKVRFPALHAQLVHLYILLSWRVQTTKQSKKTMLLPA